jgi:Reversibly glycosylated polypeptide
MTHKATLVLTTINDPVLLEGYCANFETHCHLGRIKIIVVPDKKTPAAAYERCASLQKRGMEIICPTLEEQDAYLRRIGIPDGLIPYDSDNRRNIGYLLALEAGADFLISIDDDNYCPAEVDFFQAHSVVCGGPAEAEVVESTSGWFNLCNLMRIEPPNPIYPRGFPYSARHQKPEIMERKVQTTIRMNAGLWLQEPDLDGITWLVAPARARQFSGRSRVLGNRTWSPINTQNTALHRDVISSYYFIRMGYPLAGLAIDRYGDIFSGYFSQACVRHLGHAVRVGTPVAEHRRNSHNYLKDALNEFACIVVLEDLLPWLHELKLEGNTYCQAYESLSYLVEEAVSTFSEGMWTDATRGYFHSMAYCMREWVKACRRLGAT